jgi:hypothetical protein
VTARHRRRDPLGPGLAGLGFTLITAALLFAAVRCFGT